MLTFRPKTRRCQLQSVNQINGPPDFRRVREDNRLITTTPNELCAELHNRMPVVLKPTEFEIGFRKRDGWRCCWRYHW